MRTPGIKTVSGSDARHQNRVELAHDQTEDDTVIPAQGLSNESANGSSSTDEVVVRRKPDAPAAPSETAPIAVDEELPTAAADAANNQSPQEVVTADEEGSTVAPVPSQPRSSDSADQPTAVRPLPKEAPTGRGGLVSATTPDVLFSPQASSSVVPDESVTDPYGLNSFWFESAAPMLDYYRPDFVAPSGLIADHLLPDAGRVLFSYRYQRTNYSGLRDGTSNVDTATVLGNYTYAPTKAVEERHLFLLEYAPIENLTILGQLPVIQNQITFQDATGATFKSSMVDPGDLSITAITGLSRTETQQWLLSFGISTPTGVFTKISEPAGPNFPDYTYPLRTSSGTWDLLPGLTYRGENEIWSWGAQTQGVIHTGMNTRGYRLGDELQLTGWVARRWNPHWSNSFRMTGRLQDGIHHDQPDLNQMLTPTNVPGNFGGQRLDLFLGANYYLKPECWPNQYFTFEAGTPAYQSLRGPQLRAEWMLNIGYNILF